MGIAVRANMGGVLPGIHKERDQAADWVAAAHDAGTRRSHSCLADSLLCPGDNGCRALRADDVRLLGAEVHGVHLHPNLLRRHPWLRRKFLGVDRCSSGLRRRGNHILHTGLHHLRLYGVRLHDLGLHLRHLKLRNDRLLHQRGLNHLRQQGLAPRGNSWLRHQLHTRLGEGRVVSLSRLVPVHGLVLGSPRHGSTSDCHFRTKGPAAH
mmetsp:Transcript_53247/g.121223  ORF Transcript_53247/g.121223 Transcript_53247/m.121223 type:complete len:209 (+) Transcript_53247:117-743(+)